MSLMMVEMFVSTLEVQEPLPRVFLDDEVDAPLDPIDLTRSGWRVVAPAGFEPAFWP